ncbi:MAG: type I methionyl aminopeptidase [Candidatus Pacebacteria bacterium]|jgi:methionyl aminopeptidase|nr:type I methionyl aminopeptidase [Candidatus Paceibacterota bacterium]
MAIIIKTKEEIDILRAGGKRLSAILAKVAGIVRPGISTYELDQYAYELIKEGGDEPAFLGYKPEGHRKAFPASLCTSVNSEVVHGIPRKDKILKEGDIICIDLGLKHKGLFTDHAVTVAVGAISKESQKLLDATREALALGIEQAIAGNTVGDIGHAIESFVNKRYGIVRELSGHGVGKYIHEDPYVPNFGKKGKGAKLIPGMVIAIEPMLNIGRADIVSMSDGYTIKTADGSRSAHFEHTILITEGEPEILTAR